MNFKEVFLFFIISAVCFTACDTNSEISYDIDYSDISINVVYAPYPANQYKVMLGEKVIGGSTPIPVKDLNNNLKVWLVADSLNPVLVMDQAVNLKRNAVINLVQVTADAPMLILSLEYPDSTSVMRAQFLYSDSKQPDSVRVTIVAVDKYDFVITAKYDFTKATLDTLATLSAHRNELSKNVDLDLNHFKGGSKGYEAQFYYSVSNAKTGEQIQPYNKNVRIAVDPKSSGTNDRFNARYKFALLQWKYSTSYPFNVPNMLTGIAW